MKHRIKCSLISVVLTGMAAAALAQSNIYVATNGSDATGSGQITAPYGTISNGIAKAPTAGDTVWVSNGTYVLSAQLSIANAITVSAWSVNSANTIINGGYPATTNRCVNISAAATLKGFTISNGWVNNDAGGGVYLDNASAVVTNCFITQNRAQQQGANGRGGGIFMNAAGKVTDCIISNNTASASSYGYGGGGLWCQSGGNVLNCRFLNNMLNGTNSASGGGLGVYATSAFIVSNCTFDGNMADNGGGLQLSGGGTYVRIVDCTFSNNMATNGAGGGLSFNGGIISNCVIMRNQAIGGSAGMYVGSGTGVNCVIQENLANGYDSGGVTLYGTLLNCSIINNTNLFSSAAGGGVFMRNWGGSYSLLRNCLIAGNVVTGSYGAAGVLHHSQYGTNSMVQNCTIVFNRAIAPGSGGTGGVILSTNNNSGHYGNIIYYNTGVSGGSYNNWYMEINLVVSNSCTTPTNSNVVGTGNITNAPLFIDTNSANYRLTKGSPAINTGLNQDWMIPPGSGGTVDRDGRMRRRYGTVDMGAYEAVYHGFIFTAH